MIKPVLSRQVVEDFMHLPEISRYAVEFGSNPDLPFTTASDSECWLGFYEGGKLVGLGKLHIETCCMGMCHQYSLREHKQSYQDATKQLFVWIKNNMQKELVKLNAYVPVIYAKTIEELKGAGMVIEGLDTSSYRHKGGVCDRVLLGIKIEDIGNE